METQNQDTLPGQSAESDQQGQPEPAESTAGAPQRQRVGLGRKRALGLLVLALFAGLGFCLSYLAQLDPTGQSQFIHTYQGEKRAPSIHAALRDYDQERGGNTDVSIVFARTPVEVDFESSTMQFSDGRVIPLPGSDALILVNADSHISHQPLRNRFQLLPILGRLSGMSFEQLQAELTRIDPTTATFWQN